MRVKRGFAGRRKHKRMLQLSEGMVGRRGNCYKLAKRGVEKALQYAYRDRRQNKRNYRTLWITRINAAARLCGMSYSQLIRGVLVAKLEINRKILADLAVSDPAAFAVIADQAKQAVQKEAA